MISPCLRAVLRVARVSGIRLVSRLRLLVLHYGICGRRVAVARRRRRVALKILDAACRDGPLTILY